MIGQIKNKQLVENLIVNNSFPRFIILQGRQGSGKHTFCQYVAKQLKCPCLFIDNKIESVRKMIDLGYTQRNNVLYCIEDCQSMSVRAKNSLLKICEEPCEKAYIILMTTDDSLLSTLKSRAVTIQMSPYSNVEKQEYLKTSSEMVDSVTEQYILEISENIGQVKQLLEIKDVKKLVETINKVVNGIGKASLGNALKIGSYIKTKNSSEGYDCELFLQALKFCYYEQALQDHKFMDSNYKKIKCINNCLYKFSANKYNTQTLLDNLIIELKELYETV